jgi:gas vesicle protein GvpL/GvpF
VASIGSDKLKQQTGEKTGEMKKVEAKVGATQRSVGTARYVYCILDHPTDQSSAQNDWPSGIEDETALEMIASDDLAAITSAVPLSIYGEDVLNERLQDASWTALKAMRHERVVEHFTKVGSVVPLRFGTIYLDAENVRSMLRERKSALTELLARLSGREEWGINVYFDQTELLKGIDSLSPVLTDLLSQAESASPGQAYLLRKKANALRKDESRNEVARTVSRLEDHLRENTDDVRRLRTLKVETTEHGELKAKFAVLLKKSAFAKFQSVAEKWLRDHEASGVRLEIAGPMPPYNFTDSE